MKKYKIGDIYIVNVNKVKNYTFPNWYERITHSNELFDKYVVAMVYDKKLSKVVYVTGTGVKIYGCSGDTTQVGDLFIKNKVAIGLTKAATNLPNKITTQWMNEFQNHIHEEDKKNSDTKFIEDTLIQGVILTLENYITESEEEVVKPRTSRRAFNTGKVEAYNDCINLLKNLIQKENTYK